MQIYPRPQWFRRHASGLSAAAPTVGVSAPDYLSAARRFMQALQAEHGCSAHETEAATATILLGGLDDPIVAAALASRVHALIEQARRPGGYLLYADTARIVVAGADSAGVHYGIASLLQILTCVDGRLTCPGVAISDWPASALRGVHLYLPGRTQIPFFKRLLTWIAELKYNTVFLEVGGGMRYKHRPEINAAWERFCAEAAAHPAGQIGVYHSHPFLKNSLHTELGGGSFLEQEEVRDLLAWAHELHLEVVPEVPSLSHAYYLCLAYPEIAERSDDRWPDTYCPSHPLTYEVLEDVLDEVIAVFRPRMIHIGHDEVYHLGICPRCRDTSGADLFAGDVRRIHALLAERGVRTAMWGEKLFPVYSGGAPDGGLARPAGEDRSPGSYQRSTGEQTMPAPSGPVEMMRETYQAINQLPRDILISDWFWMYDSQSSRYFHEHGFSVMLGNVGDNFVAQGFDRWNERARQPGIVGGEISTWCALSEFALGYNGAIFNIMFGAQLLWWEQYCDLDRGATSATIAELMPEVRRRLAGEHPPHAAPVTPLALPTGEAPPFICDDLQLPGAPFVVHPAMHGLRVDSAHSYAVVPVGRAAQQLIVLHACTSAKRRLPAWFLADPYNYSEADRLGWYVITYTDGEQCCVPLHFGSQIARWDVPYGEHIDAIPYWADPLQIGSDPSGRRITLYRYCWRNPRPEATISTLTLSYVGDPSGAIWLFAVTLQEP